MIRQEQAIKKSNKNPEKQHKRSIPEILATILAFISVFIFFVKILFF